MNTSNNLNNHGQFRLATFGAQ